MHYNLYTKAIEEEKDGITNTWLEEGFKRTDDLLEWCEANKMYLILDLHAAPGGQGHDANISDYDSSKPSLWESQANQDKMVALWEALATRYKDKKWIGAYDIINEPNWNFTSTNLNGCDETQNGPLRSLQLRITEAIRAIDTNHLIIIEGNCWGNNYSGMFPLWDKNMALSFHKYWNENNEASIATMLNYRAKYNVPIWMGEGGENSNVWFQEAISLLETHNIGWSFWPMKKIENIAGVTNVTAPKGYNKLLDYWETGKNKPSVSEAKVILAQLADGFKLENTTIKYDVIDAMFRQVYSDETKPYKRHQIGHKIYATDYDLGQLGHAYFDTDVANYDGTKFTKWNTGTVLRNDGVDIGTCGDEASNGYCVTDIKAGEWSQYTIEVAEDLMADVLFRVGNGSEKAAVHLEDETKKQLTEEMQIPNGNAKEKWQTLTFKKVSLKKGTNHIRVYSDKGGFSWSYMEFIKR
jgi:hypothetical protein